MSGRAELTPYYAFRDLKADTAERLFFCGGILVIGLSYILPQLLGGDTSKSAAGILQRIDFFSVCFGVLFSIVNFRAWKLFVELYTQSQAQLKTAKVTRRQRIWRFSSVVLFKASALALLLWFLFSASNVQVVSFLFSFTAFLLIGTFFVGIFFLLPIRRFRAS